MKQGNEPRRDVPVWQGVTTLKADNLVANIYKNRETMGTEAANMVTAKITLLLDKQDFVNMIFAAAPSQNEFLSALVENKAVEWNRVNAFHMDEYIGLPQNDPRTFASFLNEKVFSQLPLHSVNYIKGNAADPEMECNRYARLLSKHSPDVVCMGIGENGHIAFNDPHVANFNDYEKVKIVTLDTECRQQQVNDGCFTVLNDVPAQAITLTIPELMAGKYIYCIVPGEKKANAVFNTMNSEMIEKYPSTILRKHANSILFLDQFSSSFL